MSSKTEINKMSKKELLESLSYRQHQDSVMFNKLFLSLARAGNINPEDVAKYFLDDNGNAEYATKLNQSIDAAMAALKEKEVPASSALVGESGENIPA